MKTNPQYNKGIIMITKEELETFSKLSDKLEQELKRVVPQIDMVYGGFHKLSEKKQIAFKEISLNVKDNIDCVIYSRYISDDLDLPYRIDTKYLTMSDDDFNKFIQKEKNELDKSKLESLKKENEERALYIKLHKKYGDINKFQV